jgi:hypothetical protein
MPIRINLLAEAQAQEEMRRRDPVKRAIWVGAGLVVLVLAWSSSLQLKTIIAKGELNRLEGQVSSRATEFQQVLDNQKKLAEVNRRLEALHKLASNRLLFGTLLNGLQQATIDDVNLMRVKADQSYVLNEAVKAKTNAEDRVIAGRPASVTERVVVTLEAKDSGVNPGDQVNKFKQAIAESSYFQGILSKTNEVRLTSLSPPQGGVGGKPFVLFTLECKYPERTR